MNRFFKGFALLIALTCAVWVAVLWNWQNTQHEISVPDVVIYLGALPLTLFALVLMTRWAWQGASAKAAAGSAAGSVAGSVKGTAAVETGANAAGTSERFRTWQLLAAHGNTVLGCAPADWASAAADQAPRPKLDDELRNGEGLPVLSARVQGVDVTEVAEALEAIATPLRQQDAQQQVSAQLVRALALLQEPLAAAVQALVPWSAQLMKPPLSSAGVGSASGAMNEAAAAKASAASNLLDARVRVLLAWPTDGSGLDHEVALRWLTSQLHQLGEGLVDTGRWAVNVVPSAASRPLNTTSNDKKQTSLSGPELWLQADALMQAQARNERCDALLLLACHSDLVPETVDQLDAQGRLFSSQHPKGVIPGEAAAALLVAPAEWPADPDAQAPVPHLHRAAVAARDKSVDAAGRTAHTLSTQLVQQALAAAQLSATEVAALANDADQHTPRAAEVFGCMLEQLPALDATDDMRMTGQLCGSTGACGTLLAVAMAAHLASKLEKPCLALSVGDSIWRAALVVRPQAPPGAGSDTAAANNPVSQA